MDSTSQSRDDWFQGEAEQSMPGRFIAAERLNGRLAMLGFVIGLLTEALTGHGILSQFTFGVLGLSWWLIVPFDLWMLAVGALITAAVVYTLSQQSDLPYLKRN